MVVDEVSQKPERVDIHIFRLWGTEVLYSECKERKLYSLPVMDGLRELVEVQHGTRCC